VAVLLRIIHPLLDELTEKTLPASGVHSGMNAKKLQRYPVTVQEDDDSNMRLSRKWETIPNLVSIPSRWSTLSVAILTVNWAPFCRLEGNLAFLPTIGAGSFMHLSWTSIETAPLSKTQIISLLIGMYKQYTDIPQSRQKDRLLNRFKKFEKTLT
jgi:hypothetical protein